MTQTIRSDRAYTDSARADAPRAAETQENEPEDDLAELQRSVQETIQFLSGNWGMELHHARAFAQRYGPGLCDKYKAYRHYRAKLLEGVPEETRKTLMSHALRYMEESVLAQAYQAFMFDLKAGGRLDAAVEYMIWAILLRHVDQIQAMDENFGAFLKNNWELHYPDLVIRVYGFDQRSDISNSS